MENRARRGVVLLAHGARDPDWFAPFQRIRQRAQKHMGDALVELAFLEFMPPDLPVAVQRLVDGGCATILVVPLFLGAAGHTQRHLPPLVERLRLKHPGVNLQLVRAIGDNPQVQQAIVDYCGAALEEVVSPE